MRRQEGLGLVVGLLRTGDGDWVAGFVGFLGDTSVLQAELVAMSYGLDLAWDRGVRCIPRKIWSSPGPPSSSD